MSYATPAELASFLQVPEVDTLSAQMALDAATSRIDAVTRGWRFLPVAATTVSLAGGQRSLRLQRPVTAVASVASTSLGVVTAHAVNVDYELVGSELRWLGCYGWPDNLTVTYSRGMAAVPGDVKDACLQVTALRYGNPSGLESETIDDYTWRRSQTTDADPETQILASLRRAYPTRGLSTPLVRA